VVLRIFRLVAHEDSKIKDSALLRQRGRVEMSPAVLNIDRRRLDSVSLAVRRLRAGLLAKRAVREKEARAPMVNLGGHHEVARRLRRSAALGS
jgi:hypothetical protein